MANVQTIAVFGGSGKTGQEVISVALKKGLHLRALYRPGSEPKKVPPGLEVVIGQLTESGDIKRTLDGTSGAMIVFGPRLGRGRNPQPFFKDATSRIIEQMKLLGINRLICQTGAMAGGDNPNWSTLVRRFVKSYRRRFPAIDADRDAQGVVVKNSGLDWTLVRPFRIANGRAKSKVIVAQAVHIGSLTSIRRANLADFLVTELTDGKRHEKVVYIVN